MDPQRKQEVLQAFYMNSYIKNKTERERLENENKQLRILLGLPQLWASMKNWMWAQLKLWFNRVLTGVFVVLSTGAMVFFVFGFLFSVVAFKRVERVEPNICSYDRIDHKWVCSGGNGIIIATDNAIPQCLFDSDCHSTFSIQSICNVNGLCVEVPTGD